jgi:hypothetical protein
MTETYIYGGKPVKTENAEGVKGILIHGVDGYIFRVYSEDGSFVDYKIRHDDLPVTIDQDALASFYFLDEETAILDHSPGVLGLKPADSQRHD